MIIAVEGLDGVGKTTFSRILAGVLDATYVRLPPPELLLATTSLFSKHDSLARYLYYMSGVAALAETARSATVVVADRYVASAHALHLHVRGEAAELLRRLPLPAPELTFFLEADEATRRGRLALRGSGLDPFEQALNDSELFRVNVSERLRSFPGTHAIDTTNRVPDEVVDIAMEILHRRIHGGQDAGPEQ